MKDLKEFEKWLEKARESKEEQLPFVWEIMKSPYVEYHYSLLKDKTLHEEFRRNLRSRFDEHHEAGQAFLLSKLDNDEDVDFHGEIIFMLGKLNDRRNRPGKDKVIDYVRKLALSSDGYTRERAIIVLGWIGVMEDVLLLADRLMNDSNEKCRTWAATSFMQMWFRTKSEELVAKALPHLYQSIKQEKDYFALGSMIDVVKELTGKKFGLPQYAIDSVDIEKIESAKLKVERFFRKLYHEL
ncbi:HEAT repeat domain-containing protein [Dysgonomonas sp. Marseille-P4361]|uniref:HEAT repeat domain-containing protein n=1 Tax=Dysgonomonas sp. Marseille-P4361 TaxID=2161820 RepID=UPI000D560B1F|nr:HEAT repeat domain-containing protein [Dysgonomonas sp. Marseille-P4361]